MNNEELIARIEKLEKWKTDRERQQITLPLDPTSIDILNNYFMRLTGAYITVGGAGGHTFVTSSDGSNTTSRAGATNLLTAGDNANPLPASVSHTLAWYMFSAGNGSGTWQSLGIIIEPFVVASNGNFLSIM